MKHNFRIKLVTAAVIACINPAISFAAEEEQPENIETIEVTGFRGSLQKAINAKRFSNSVVDSIHAEDVGKSTDQNIADALSRVTGVTVQDSDGEGTKISIRGAGAALNQISMNGVPLTSGLSGSGDSATADQSVDLSSFSSDILSSIDVQKTASADHDEGSLGANVVLRTVRPLSLKKPKRSFEYQGRYNDFSGDFDRKLSLTFSDKYFDDTVGVIFTLADETQNARKDEFSGNWDETVYSAEAGKWRDANTGEIGTEAMPYIAMSNANYTLNVNERKRLTATMGLQYIPLDSTEIQLDVSYSKQEIQIDNHRYNMQFGNTDANNADDPQQDWWIIDPETHTQTKRLMRPSRARLYRQLGGDELENTISSLNIKHHITDDLTADLNFGYSRTTSNSLPNASIALVPGGNSSELPISSNDPNELTLEPTGYDCSTGKCELVVGEKFSQYIPGEKPNGATTIAPSATNPLDPYLFRAQNVVMDDDQNSDTSKTAFIDFDWHVDTLGITKIEFGGKYSNRLKDVSSNRTQISDGTPLLDEEGQVYSSNGISSIIMADLLEQGAFPVDNFMEGVIDNRAPFLAGWGIVDPFKALEITSPASGGDGKDIRAVTTPKGSRTIEQTINAAYAKVNFEYFDGFMTGNLGLRYVNTKTAAQAFNSISYYDKTNMFDPVDLFVNRQLANTDLPACDLTLTNIDYPLDANGNIDQNQYPNNLPAAGTCHEPSFIYDYHKNDLVDGVIDAALQTPDNQILAIQYDQNGNLVSVDQNTASTAGRNGRFIRNWNLLGAYVDRSTVDQHIVDGKPLGTIASERLLRANDTASNNVFLPSLNLNFVFSNELIGRFALSKTMARPTFDATTPSGSIKEDQFKPFGNGKISRVDLKPLESTNIDISLEWYFSDTGLFSVALFNKDMKNFEEEVSESYLWKDLRTNYTLEGINNLDDVLITPEAVIDEMTGLQMKDQFTDLPMWTQTPLNTPEGSAQCMPDRVIHTHLINNVTLNCHLLVLDVKRNGKGAYTRGLEATYTQNYDFLPGLWSGLGMSVNYTFADSESEEEVSETTGISVKPLPQPFTPRHSANLTMFWEKGEWMFRLANRYNSTQLVSRNTASGLGASWLEASNRLDFSSTYQVNKNLMLTFQALNLTDEVKREFMTSTAFEINGERLDEGNAMTDSVPTNRTMSEFKTGRQYRIGLRASF